MKTSKNIENKNEYPSFIKSALALNGSVTPKVLKQVLITSLYAVFISIMSLFFEHLSIPVSPFEYAGLVMGLILVFRVNAGYDRWWEARKIWGNVVNNSRNLAIIIASYVQKDKREDVDQLIKYISAMPYLMKNHLRGETSIEEVNHLINPEISKGLKNSSHKPIFISTKIAMLLSELLRTNNLNQFSFLNAEKCREEILDCQGASERILKTPMPFVMAVKSRRFILLFLLVLPFALIDYSIYLNPLVTALVSYALFSLDQIGVELQNPFSKERLSNLPLDGVCQLIETNLMEIYKDSLHKEKRTHNFEKESVEA
ncbi:MAG: bestrophin family ion channel [Legionellaceae bacterium]|nr:bestrophin family ion channel [Legionellaceae bacterium]